MPTTLEQLQYGFDRDSRRTWRQRASTQGWDNAYAYDSLSQVTGDDRGDLNLAQNAIAGIPLNGARWDYDETGNWHGYQTLESGAAVINQSRTHDKGNRLMELEGAAAMRTDRAGRMLQTVPGPQQAWSQSWQVTWDAWSRITQVSHVEGSENHQYAYDGMTRRTSHTNNQSGVTMRSYYNDQWRPVEERKNSETTANVCYLWGARHRDDLVRRDRAVGGTSLNEMRYILMDYFSPAAITDGVGVVKERYAFSAFGLRTILNPDFTPRTNSESGLEFSFQGQFEDVETGWMNYGYRYYLPALGRWACKDPIGLRGGLNLFLMASNNPISQVDHLGLEIQVSHNAPDPSKIVPDVRDDGSSGTTFENESVKCGDCKCTVENKHRRWSIPQCTVSWSASIVVSYSESATKSVPATGIYGHEQMHVLSAKSRVESQVVTPLGKEKELFTGANAEENCKKAKNKYEEDYLKKLKAVLQDPDVDHKGDNKGKDTPFSPKDAQPYPPQPNSVWP